MAEFPSFELVCFDLRSLWSDEQYYESLKFIMDNDLSKMPDIGETFCHTKQIGEEVLIYDMIPDGKSTELTEENKQLFVELK